MILIVVFIKVLTKYQTAADRDGIQVCGGRKQWTEWAAQTELSKASEIY